MAVAVVVTKVESDIWRLTNKGGLPDELFVFDIIRKVALVG
jgi:hypothetical protein